MNSTTIKKNRKIIRTQSWKPFLKRTWKLDFPIWRNKKSIETRPRGNLLIIRPRKWPSCKRKIHKILLKNKIRKLHHSRIKTNVSRSFSRKACDIEVTPDAPRQLPSRRKASQLIPERNFKRVKVRTVDPSKSPRGVISNASERTGNNELTHIHINLLYNPSIPYNQNTTRGPARS